MYPILLNLGKFNLYTYGLFLALGFMAAIWFSKRNARGQGIQGEDISDLFLVILVASIVGARLLYVGINFSRFQANPKEIFQIWNGGLVFFGGFIAAVGACVAALKMKGLPILKTADAIAPGIALGHGIGRLGCLFAGCCYGKACDLPIAVTFTHPGSLAPLNVPLHPTQIYMVISNLAVFAILVLIGRKKRFDGMVFLSYIMIYSAFRSVIEYFRGDFRGDFFFEFLSLSQGIGLTVSVIALILVLKLSGSAHGHR